MIRRLINDTTGQLVCERMELAVTPWRRLVGLLGHSGLEPDEGLLLDPCQAVHTWGMRFPIDVVFVNRTRVVTRIVSCLAPWRMAWGGPGSVAVVELPTGGAARAAVQTGHRLKW